MPGDEMLERWMRHHGVPARNVADVLAATQARAARYPFPVHRAHGPMSALFDRLAPTLVLQTRKRASELDDDAFEELEQRLQHHPVPLVRALYTLVRAPVLEQLYPDVGAEPPDHPLQGVRFGTTHFSTDFDVLVIGSGAGGAPVATALAEKGYSVAIIESGGLVTTESTTDSVERRYLNQAMVGSLGADGMTLIMAGNAIGGTTAINSGTSFRPRPERLAAWDAEVGTDFADGTLEGWLDAAEAAIGVHTPDWDLMDASADLVKRGFAALGRDEVFVLPRNAKACQGEARCCFGCPQGAKQSTDRSFLPRALAAGAVLFAHTRATQIREHADGVSVFVSGPDGRRRLRGRHLVVSAGALATPHLIRSNKLGSRWRDAGDHLRIHPATKIFALMPHSLPHGGVPQGVGYRPPDLPHITFEGVHTPPAAAAPILTAAGVRHKWWMDRYDRLATFGMMCRDRNTGSVRGVGPTRMTTYQLHPDDARDIGAGVLLAARAFFEVGAQRVMLPVAGADFSCEVDSLQALDALSPSDFTPRSLMTSGFHPQGTAGIGRVVDADLRLTDRISVSDASVLPGSPGVNPQVTLMALGLRLADHLATEVL